MAEGIAELIYGSGHHSRAVDMSVTPTFVIGAAPS